VLGEGKKIQCKTFLHRVMSQWVSMKTNRGGECSKDYKVSINCYSLRVYVHNWVNWTERDSDHKILYNVERNCGAIILKLYMTVRGI